MRMFTFLLKVLLLILFLRVWINTGVIFFQILILTVVQINLDYILGWDLLNLNDFALILILILIIFLSLTFFSYRVFFLLAFFAIFILALAILALVGKVFQTFYKHRGCIVIFFQVDVQLRIIWFRVQRVW